MPVTTQVLFDKPQMQIATLIRDRLARCQSASIVSGFITVAGINSIAAPFRRNPTKLAELVVGAGTYSAFEALDGLVSARVPANRLFVHLGHSACGSGFRKYRPMLHSKIYLMQMADETSCAFVGSHNATDFALNGKNGEAGILIEGPSNDPQFVTIRQHIAECRRQATLYDPAMKDAYNWWAVQFIEGLKTEIEDAPREIPGKRTVVILAVKADDPLPHVGDIIYFEISAKFAGIKSLTSEVHFYVLPSVSGPFAAALETRDQARAALVCQTIGLELEQGGDELKTRWMIRDNFGPLLLSAPKPFRPNPAPGTRQVRVKVVGTINQAYDYLNQVFKQRWEPVCDTEEYPLLSSECEENGKASYVQWALVKDLTSEDETRAASSGQSVFPNSQFYGPFMNILLRRPKEIPPLNDSEEPLV